MQSYMGYVSHVLTTDWLLRGSPFRLLNFRMF